MEREDKDTLFFLRPIESGKEESVCLYHLRAGIRTAGKRTELYFLNLPMKSYRGPRFLVNICKEYEKKNLEKSIDQAYQTLRKRIPCGKLECCVPPEITERLDWKEQAVPTLVYDAMLKNQSFFDKLTIHVPEDGCMELYELLPELLNSYMPHIHEAVVTGSQGDTAIDVENWLSEEYGIAACWQQAPLEGSVLVDLAGDFESWKCQQLERTECVPRIRMLLSPPNAWKFLDTTVKNGYNTKVN